MEIDCEKKNLLIRYFNCFSLRMLWEIELIYWNLMILRRIYDGILVFWGHCLLMSTIKGLRLKKRVEMSILDGHHK